MNAGEARTFLQDLFYAAVDSAKPDICVPKYLPKPPKGRTIVIGFGKASAAMAKALEQNWPTAIQGTVVTRYGHEVNCENIKIIQASHPEPDESSQNAAKQILQQVKDLSVDDLVICLISGGGSALLSLPHPGISMAEKQAINRQLLKSGANIAEINCVRRHLSAIKGGKLALACQPARLVNLLISDVPGDDLNNIASGPTVADSSTCIDALDIIARYKIDVPAHIIKILKSKESETIKPANPVFNRVVSSIIASPWLALQAAAELAIKSNIKPYILSDQIEGEAKDVGKVLAALALNVRRHQQPFQKPCVILSGGEITVTVKGSGLGGRNVEGLLSTAIQLNGEAGVYGLYADTDGIDGQAEIAGAFIDPNTIHSAHAKNMSAQSYLDNNDGHSFFSLLDNSLISGPTLTNVNDFRALLIL